MKKLILFKIKIKNLLVLIDCWVRNNFKNQSVVVFMTSKNKIIGIIDNITCDHIVVTGNHPQEAGILELKGDVCSNK